MPLSSIEGAIARFKAGLFVIIVDDEDRENEGDLICSAELCSEQNINFMATQGRGLICVSLTEDRAKKLDLPLMVSDNTALHGTRFTVSVDYVHGTASGISVSD
ncbi:MAG: bifunctional 3,4-dihydroxy-2-butanone-4-phosphate synthase/GTP cyclohydrolase II, partial [Proteobacteria bacterium]|nr:bifunctional 3,4-dihydroxy-2-butanone-4-phosphate synthase/GTP cyclohydrolase II [Pseudomonadota bacterium]